MSQRLWGPGYRSPGVSPRTVFKGGALLVSSCSPVAPAPTGSEQFGSPGFAFSAIDGPTGGHPTRTVRVLAGPNGTCMLIHSDQPRLHAHAMYRPGRSRAHEYACTYVYPWTKKHSVWIHTGLWMSWATGHRGPLGPWPEKTPLQASCPWKIPSLNVRHVDLAVPSAARPCWPSFSASRTRGSGRPLPRARGPELGLARGST